MSESTGFTGYVSDLSNQNGFQWEFHCGRCSSEFRSDFVADNVSRFRGVVRGVSDLIGGQAYRVSSAADSFGGMFSSYGGASSAKDKAYARAVEAAKRQFNHCGGCGAWVCSSCWNGRVGMCQNCSPLAEHDLARAQASARGYQMRDAAAEQDWMRGQQPDVPVRLDCPSCGSHTTGGRFCGACGTSLQPAVDCRACGHQLTPGALFCTNCGQMG